MKLSKKRALVLATLVAPLGLVQPAMAEEYCREFNTEIEIEGQERPAYGMACRQEDGSWKIQPNTAHKPLTTAKKEAKAAPKKARKMADITRTKTVKHTADGGRVVKIVTILANGDKVIEHKRFHGKPAKRHARHDYRKHQPKHMKRHGWRHDAGFDNRISFRW